MTITEQLAEALRRALDTIDACGSINMDEARALLAAWDATNQPREPQPLGDAPRGTL